MISRKVPECVARLKREHSAFREAMDCNPEASKALEAIDLPEHLERTCVLLLESTAAQFSILDEMSKLQKAEAQRRNIEARRRNLHSNLRDIAGLEDIHAN